jgi:hypothetical protein
MGGEAVFWKRSKKIEKVVGNEYDAALYRKLRQRIESLGGTLEKEIYFIVGQEVRMEFYRLHGKKITVTLETYMGISVAGDQEIVEEICSGL